MSNVVAAVSLNPQSGSPFESLAQSIADALAAMPDRSTFTDNNVLDQWCLGPTANHVGRTYSFLLEPTVGPRSAALFLTNDPSQVVARWVHGIQFVADPLTADEKYRTYYERLHSQCVTKKYPIKVIDAALVAIGSPEMKLLASISAPM